MDETNEVEALAKVALKAWNNTPHQGCTDEAWSAVARAVRDAVLASLAARGSGQFVEVCALIQEWLETGGPIPNEVVRQFMPGVRSQGATIAALQQRVAELVETCKSLNNERNTFFDQSCANQQRAEESEKARVAAAESSATLRQASSAFTKSIREAMADSEPTRIGLDALDRLESLESVLSAIPAPEHPDTVALRDLLAAVHGDGGHRVAEVGMEQATREARGLVPGWKADSAELRAIRERATTWRNTGRLGDESRAALEYVLGDSSPSGGVVYENSRGNLDTRARFPGDATPEDDGPSEGGDDASNVCEHGDHPAPPGERFCSEACKRCETADAADGDECANLCTASTPPGLAACVPASVKVCADGAEHVCGEEGTECATCQLPGEPVDEPETLRTHVNRAKEPKVCYEPSTLEGGHKPGTNSEPSDEMADICSHGSLTPCGMCEPTEAEDWATVERVTKKLIDPFPPPTSGDVDDAKAALARLKQSHQRAAAEMRERCAAASPTIVGAVLENLGDRSGILEGIDRQTMDDIRSDLQRVVSERIRALPLKP